MVAALSLKRNQLVAVIFVKAGALLVTLLTLKCASWISNIQNYRVKNQNDVKK